MAKRTKKDYEQIAGDLVGFLADSCPGIDVTVGRSERWQRTCLTFRWEGFRTLLLEERFRRIARLIPPEYFRSHCRDAVWLELAPDESIDEFLAQPRSEDVDSRLPDIWKMLRGCSFFAALEDELVRIPLGSCPDDLSVSKRVLAAKNLTADEVRDACLAFIRKEACNDWEVLQKVRPIAESRRRK